MDNWKPSILDSIFHHYHFSAFLPSMFKVCFFKLMIHYSFIECPCIKVADADLIREKLLYISSQFQSMLISHSYSHQSINQSILIYRCWRIAIADKCEICWRGEWLLHQQLFQYYCPLLRQPYLLDHRGWLHECSEYHFIAIIQRKVIAENLHRQQLL